MSLTAWSSYRHREKPRCVCWPFIVEVGQLRSPADTVVFLIRIFISIRSTHRVFTSVYTFMSVEAFIPARAYPFSSSFPQPQHALTHVHEETRER